MEQPKSRPLSDDAPLGQLIPTRFLKVSNLLAWGVTSVVVTVDHLQEEEVTPKPGQPPEWKPVLYFRNRQGAIHPQGYLLSAKADLASLTAATNAISVGDLAGKRAKIKIDTWRGRQVLRIDADPPKP